MSDQVSIQALKATHLGQTAWIVGKGPSLVRLSREHIGEGPVIAINEAIVAVETLELANTVYSMQKDADEYDVSSTPNVALSLFIPIKSATLLVHLHESPNRLKEYSPRYVFDNVKDFGLEWWECSGLVAIAVARLMGCSNMVYLCFDACMSGDRRTCTPTSDGAYEVLSTDEAYLGQCCRIDDYLTKVGMPAEWVTPEKGESHRHDDPSLDRVRADRDESRREARRLRLVAYDLTRETERLADAVTQAGREVERLAAALSEANTGVERSRGELEAALRRNYALTDDLAAARSRVAELLSSASWRWMAPLRAAYRILARSK